MQSRQANRADCIEAYTVPLYTHGLCSAKLRTEPTTRQGPPGVDARRAARRRVPLPPARWMCNCTVSGLPRSSRRSPCSWSSDISNGVSDSPTIRMYAAGRGSSSAITGIGYHSSGSAVVSAGGAACLVVPDCLHHCKSRWGRQCHRSETIGGAINPLAEWYSIPSMSCCHLRSPHRPCHHPNLCPVQVQQNKEKIEHLTHLIF